MTAKEQRLRFMISRLSEREQDCLINILDELDQAKGKHPKWPKDNIHAAAIVAEESGELIRASLIAQYENGYILNLETEAIQTGAMALRFLSNLKR